MAVHEERMMDIDDWLDALDRLDFPADLTAPAREAITHAQRVEAWSSTFRRNAEQALEGALTALTDPTTDYAAAISAAQLAALAARDETHRDGVCDVIDTAAGRLNGTAWRTFQAQAPGYLPTLTKMYADTMAEIAELGKDLHPGAVNIELAARAGQSGVWLRLEELAERYDGITDLISSWYETGALRATGRGVRKPRDVFNRYDGAELFWTHPERISETVPASLGAGRDGARHLWLIAAIRAGGEPALLTPAEADKLRVTAPSRETQGQDDRQRQYELQQERKQATEEAIKALERRARRAPLPGVIRARVA